MRDKGLRHHITYKGLLRCSQGQAWIKNRPQDSVVGIRYTEVTQDSVSTLESSWGGRTSHAYIQSARLCCTFCAGAAPHAGNMVVSKPNPISAFWWRERQKSKEVVEWSVL